MEKILKILWAFVRSVIPLFMRFAVIFFWFATLGIVSFMQHDIPQTANRMVERWMDRAVAEGWIINQREVQWVRVVRRPALVLAYIMIFIGWVCVAFLVLIIARFVMAFFSTWWALAM